VNWIEQWLTGRKQRVKIGDTTTDWKDVESGVIQGSVLGPTLFVLFIQSITDLLPPEIKCLKYADDILLYCPLKLGLIQTGMDCIQQWAVEHGMRLNPTKTQHIIWFEQKNTPPTTVTLDGAELEQASSYKYLGLQIDDNLDPAAQWQLISSKVRRLAYLLKELKRVGFKEEIIINTYRSLVLSLISYGAPLFCSCTKATLHEMQVAQNRVFRITGITRENALANYNIPSVEQFTSDICQSKLERILNDPNHPITNSLQRQGRRTRGFEFTAPKAKTAKYGNSFLPKTLNQLIEKAASDTKRTFYDEHAASRAPCFVT